MKKSLLLASALLLGGLAASADGYGINFDADATITHASRYSTSVSLGDESRAIDQQTSKLLYIDLTESADPFVVTAGKEYTPAIAFVGS